MKSVIYKIINLVNDKFYVGSTTDQKVRFRQHRKLLRGSRHHCKHLQAAWNKYGETKFAFVVVEEVPNAHLLAQAEDRWLSENFKQDHCYNSGRTASAPWRGVYGEQHPNFGRAHTPAQKAAISATLKAFYAEDYLNHPRVGKTHSDETKAKISAKKLANPSRHWLGKERSEETKSKISEAQKGVPKAPRVYTPEGLERARENMKRHAVVQVVNGLESVLAKFPADVQERYDFSNAVYTGALQRITGVVCGKHGVFSQYSARFRKSAGCPQCGDEQRVLSKKAQMTDAWSNPDEREKMLKARIKIDITIPT